MLKDARTWTTLLYFMLMLPLGILYFVIAIVGLAVGLRLLVAPVIFAGLTLGWFPPGAQWGVLDINDWSIGTPDTVIGALVEVVLGVVILTLLMHAARGIARGHARLAKALLVEPGA